MKKHSFAVLPLLIALAYAPTQAAAAAVGFVAPQLPNLTVYGKTYTSQGANSIVYGNVWSGDVSTIGDHGTVTGNFSSVNASNTGATGTVGGNIVSGGVTTVGANGMVAGNISSAGAATTGDSAHLAGNLLAGGVTTVGANATVQGWLSSGDAAVIGVNAHVAGTVSATGLINVGAGGTTGIQSTLAASPIGLPFTTALAAENLNKSQQVGSAHSFLTGLGTGTALTTTMTTSTTLVAGVYSAANFSTTAGTTLTLDGQGLDNQVWVFNFTDYFVTGASTKMVLINGGLNDSIFWNTSGYSMLGADSNLLGTVIATDYISVGASTVVSGIANGLESTCGGVFSTTSYVSAGDSAVIGGAGCSNLITTAVPEPTTSALLLAGLGVLGMLSKRLRR